MGDTFITTTSFLSSFSLLFQPAPTCFVVIHTNIINMNHLHKTLQAQL